MNNMTNRVRTGHGASRLAVLALTAAGAALALSACSSGTGSSGGSGGTGTTGGSSSSASSSAGTGTGTTTGGGSGTGGTGTTPTSATGSTTGSSTGSGSGAGGSSGTGSSAVAACTSNQLGVAQENPSVGAGQYYSTLVFTNKSSSTCTMTGYPGVSYVVANGVQSGNPAVRSGGTVATVTLKPGGTASAVLHDSNGISGYTPQQCQLTPAQGLRIYPPNEKAALFLPWSTSHCAGLSIHPLSIGPVTQ